MNPLASLWQVEQPHSLNQHGSPEAARLKRHEGSKKKNLNPKPQTPNPKPWPSGAACRLLRGAAAALAAIAATAGASGSRS